MATITTTIREPKTFQQIQDQQNELEKNQTLESLNNNISKLIKAITDRDQKRETEQDRQLKMNQLELSKLQLRRAQLGLAKDEKYYSDYSRKWSEKNNFGTSMGLDKNTSGNLGAIGVSALTAGALNPVIVKQLLFPIMTPLMNITKALATFPGLFPGLFRRSSGKSSSAIASDPDRKLHGKLDQILGAIKDKARGNKKEKEEQEGLLSKLLKMLVLGAAGLSLVGAALGGEEGLVKNTLIEHGKAMLAGFVLGGWKGALVGLALDVFAKTTGIIPKETDKPTIIDVAADNARQKIEEWANIKISDTEFKLAVAGMMIAGPKGMLAGYILGNDKVQEAIRAFRENGFEGLKDLADRTILKMAKDTPLEGIPVDVIEGAIAGAAAGSTFGIKGFVSGAILGAAGGFAWDRYKNATIPEKAGINTNFDFSKGDFVISGTDKTYSDFLEPLLLEEIKDKDGNTKFKYTREQAEKLAIERIKQYLEDGKIDNSETSLTSSFLNFVSDHPLEIAGLAGLTAGIVGLSGLIDGTGVTSLLKNFGLIGVIVGLTTIANDLWKTLEGKDEVTEYIEEHQEELKDLPVSQQIAAASGQIDGKRIVEGAEKIRNGDPSGLWDIGVGTYGAFKNSFQEAGAVIAEGKLQGNRRIYGQHLRYKISDTIEDLVSDPNVRGLFTQEGSLWWEKFFIKNSPLIKALGLSEKEVEDFNNLMNELYTNNDDSILTDQQLTFMTNMYRLLQSVENGKNGLHFSDDAALIQMQSSHKILLEKEAKIINEQNEEKINKEEKKQKEEENQCLNNNTDQMSTLTQTLQDVNETLKKQTPIQWVDGQPQPVIEGYTPTPNGTSPFNAGPGM